MIQKITNITVYSILLAIICFASYSIYGKLNLGWKSWLWEIVSVILVINSYFQYRLLLVSTNKVKRYEQRFFNIDKE